MVKAKLNEEMIELLKDLKNSKFLSYECKETFGNIYGNFRINTDRGSVEITNLEKTMPFFDTEEEVTSFECTKVDPNTEFEAFTISKPEKIKVGEIIKEIEIINDFIRVSEEDFEISFDQAIIIRTDKRTIMFSRTIWFSETIRISDNDDYDSVYPISEAALALSNYEEYEVSVRRTVRKL